MIMRKTGVNFKEGGPPLDPKNPDAPRAKGVAVDGEAAEKIIVDHLLQKGK